MGLLVDGAWQDRWYDTEKTGGRFERQASQFRNWITADGSAGSTGDGGFKAEGGRYHLYVSYACPWAHRTLIARQVKGLDDIVSVDVVHPVMGKDGWTFAADFDGATGDRVNHTQRLYEVYLLADPKFTGRVTVPTLWDRQTRQIVNNESSEILRMFNSAFDDAGASGPDLYPDTLREKIDDVNARVYDTVNNGVYKAGFATSQRAYEEAFRELFATLDWLDDRLSHQRYAVANSTPTEADWRLFTTLVRFDAVYFGHFKCNWREIRNYPALSGYLRDLYQHMGVAHTVHFDHIKTHYYASHQMINPTRIVPVGPEFDLDAPHDRATLS
ncbi:glutathione S-transferase family protein [Filomicrobium sp.]|uniref:glutathione S-transferase family protein n=1 Tax=Filomicrobium sp. TaxID=2024831 RepID=UPI0025903A98|nr:glutathione S-transferase family protein [Filomicrobium sp.]MCV0370454.1 glutathione S-transferase family protein [Filomicrobium sp.]